MNIQAWQLVIALLGTSTVASIVGALVTALMNKEMRGAQVEEMQASAAQKVVEASQGLLGVMTSKIDRLEKENMEIKNELCKIKKHYSDSIVENKTLKARIRLLAMIIGQLVEASKNTEIDELINGIEITEDERDFLVDIINGIDEN